MLNELSALKQPIASGCRFVTSDFHMQSCCHSALTRSRFLSFLPCLPSSECHTRGEHLLLCSPSQAQSLEALSQHWRTEHLRFLHKACINCNSFWQTFQHKMATRESCCFCCCSTQDGYQRMLLLLSRTEREEDKSDTCLTHQKVHPPQRLRLRCQWLSTV